MAEVYRITIWCLNFNPLYGPRGLSHRHGDREPLPCSKLVDYRQQRNETPYQECMPCLDYPHKAQYSGTDTHGVFSPHLSRVLVEERLSTKKKQPLSRVLGICQAMADSVISCLHTPHYL